MKVIIPVSHADVHLLQGTINIIQSIGGLSAHDVTIISTPSVRQAADDAVIQLTDHCRHIRAFHWEMDNNSPWPKAGNLMWQQALIQVGLQEVEGDIQPWFYMGPFNCPIQPGWMNTIESRYVMSGAKFGGMVSQPKARLSDNTYTSDRIIPGQPENIPYLVGTGIYPPNCGEVIRGLWRCLPHDAPWDMFLRYTTTKAGICSIPEMEHRPRTHKYVEAKDGSITCQSVSVEPQFTDFAGTIGSDAVMVYGCKDTSLQDIVLKRYPLKDGKARAAQLTEPSPETSAMPAKDPAPLSPANEIHYDRGLSREFDIKMANSKSIEDAEETPAKSPAKKAASKKSSRWASLNT